ncbi:MAG: hypothetical protein B1H03_01110 [Planctomycetales bacterium 4484_113]|nr:MAG: hypothetical protein B1H03_01110 [Planctomycetales bacterium 4484_113]
MALVSRREEPTTGTDRFFLTTPIYYINARPHLGTCYTTVIADIIARYQRMRGRDVLLVTGSDENSQKTVIAAKEAGEEPLPYCDQMVKHYHDAWRELNIGPYEFVRTTEARHARLVQHFFSRLYEQGDIYQGTYSGWYCTPCETFFTERELKPENLCPKCERPAHPVEEEAYFFRLSTYEERLRRFFADHPDFVLPSFRRNEMLSRLNEGLQDICVSRSSLEWGIRLPWDEKHVFYVWVEALLAYLTGSGYRFDEPDSAHYWPPDLHLMAKDIPWFHAIVFPAMLMAYGLPPANQMIVHGYWLIRGGKMSKSKGLVITPHEVVDLMGADGLRYFYAREVPLGLDGTISLEAIVERYNFELGNDLGNLLNRLLPMTERYFDGAVPEQGTPASGDAELAELTEKVTQRTLQLYGDYELSRGIEEVFSLVRAANKYIDERKPWELAQQPQRKDEFSAGFSLLFTAIRNIAVLLAPVIPTSAQRIWEQLGLTGDLQELGFSVLEEPFPAGTHIGHAEPLFPRVEMPERTAEPAKPVGAHAAPDIHTTGELQTKEEPMEASQITFDDFMRVEIIAAKILSAERVEGTDKLIKMNVDDGRGGRVCVAGIGHVYEPEKLVGLTLPMVANLKPAKLRGVLSEGMILAAQDDAGNLSLVVLDKDIAPGSRIT